VNHVVDSARVTDFFTRLELYLLQIIWWLYRVKRCARRCEVTSL